MFNKCKNLTNISFGTDFKANKETNMSSMFGSCTSLQSLNLSTFNTTAVTDMEDMFYDCETLTSLDLSKYIINPQLIELGLDIPQMMDEKGSIPIPEDGALLNILIPEKIGESELFAIGPNAFDGISV